jgi:pseudouridine-5'-phosphate glycosidase
VREAGAVPATVALLDGRIRVGLEDGELERLATAEGVAKCSPRDLAPVLARGGLGATTVAGTIFVAARLGIRLMATGGIGGVHRGAETTFDISADLDELASTPVAVVSAGAKSILDLPRTLEVLETRGVPVVGYGTDEFPAFFSRTSGLPVDARVDTPQELAAVLLAHRRLGLRGGVLVANPVPAADALAAEEVDGAIDQAVDEAERAGISRRELTPFLLARVVELTGGRSLAANVALVRDNARVAALAAVALAAAGAP